MTDATSVTPIRYRAFISYSHADRSWGDWLHKSLEAYRVPSKLVGMPTVSAGDVPKRVYPIFRDREELPTSADLGGQIIAALAASQFLIVICSPRSAKSRWVNEEILAFKRMGREARILPIIVDGEPNATDKPGFDPDTECFAPALRFAIGADGALTDHPFEPICADARPQGDGKPNALLKLAAGLLGVGFDALKQRDAEARRKRLIVRSTAAALAVLAAAGGSFYLARQQSQAGLDRSLALAQKAELASDAASYEQAARFALTGLNGADALLTGYAAREAETQLRRAAASSAGLSGVGDASSPVIRSALAPDGLTFAAVRTDNTIQILDSATGAERLRLKGHTAAIDVVAYSPDGKYLVSGDAERVAIVWDAATGAEVARMAHHRTPVREIALSPDGGLVASSGDSETLIWKIGTGELVSQLHDDPQAPNLISGLSFSPDGTRVLVGGLRDGIRVWETATGRLVTQFPVGDPARGGADLPSIDHAGFTPNGKHIVSHALNGTVAVFDASTYEFLGSIRYDHQIVGFDISPDGDLVAMAHMNAGAAILDLRTGELAYMVGNPDIHTVAFSADGQSLALGTYKGAVGIWTIGAQAQPNYQWLHTTNVHDLRFGGQNERLLSRSGDGTVRIWRAGIASEAIAGEWPMLNSQGIALSPDGARIALGFSSDSIVTASTLVTNPETGELELAGGEMVQEGVTTYTHIRDLTTGEKTVQLGERAVNIQPGAFAPDGSRIVVGADEPGEIVRDAATGAVALTLDFRETPQKSAATHHAVYSRDGTRIVTASADGRIITWDSATGREIATFTVEADQVGWNEFLALSPDNSRLVTPSPKSPRDAARHGVSLWDMAAGREIVLLEPAMSGHARSAAFSPDGSEFAVSFSSAAFVRYDARTGAEIARGSIGENQNTSHIAYAPGRDMLFVGTAGGEVVVWDRIAHREIWRQSFLRTGDLRVAPAPDGKGFVTAPDILSEDQMIRTVRLPPALLESPAQLKERVCAQTLSGGRSVYSNDDLRAAPFLDPVLDRDPCDPPSSLMRTAYALGIEGWTTGYYRHDPRAAAP